MRMPGDYFPTVRCICGHELQPNSTCPQCRSGTYTRESDDGGPENSNRRGGIHRSNFI